MKILILGLNYSPEKVGIAVYTTGMTEALTARGHELQVIAGQPYYPSWSVPDGYSRCWYGRGVENGIDVTRAPHYVPQNPSGAKRVIHHATFAATTLLPMLVRAITWRPDIVFTVAPSLIAAPVALLAAKLCGARSWLHIQDFEVEAAFATGLLTHESVVGKWAEHFEQRVIHSFDRVSTISPQMCAKLVSKGIPSNRVVEFRNWANIDAIRPLDASSSFRAEWNIRTPHVALYSGNIANKQGIEIVVKAAKRLVHREDLTFVVCGEGPNRDNLRAQAAGLTNIQFHDLQAKGRLNDLVGLATIHLLPQLAGASDLVLPSKLTNMLASGRPVVATAISGTGLANEVDGCGIVTFPEDPKAFASAIETLMDDPGLYKRLSESARKRAEERWSGVAILERIGLDLENTDTAPQRTLDTVQGRN